MHRITYPICSLFTGRRHAITLVVARLQHNGHLFLPRSERWFGDRAFSVASWNRLPTKLKLVRSLTTTFKHHRKTFLFNSTPPTDYGMPHRSNCRMRTTNAAVTVTEAVWADAAWCRRGMLFRYQPFQMQRTSPGTGERIWEQNVGGRSIAGAVQWNR